jgi:hypothetical protein
MFGLFNRGLQVLDFGSKVQLLGTRNGLPQYSESGLDLRRGRHVGAEVAGQRLNCFPRQGQQPAHGLTEDFLPGLSEGGLKLAVVVEPAGKRSQPDTNPFRSSGETLLAQQGGDGLLFLPANLRAARHESPRFWLLLVAAVASNCLLTAVVS